MGARLIAPWGGATVPDCHSTPPRSAQQGILRVHKKVSGREGVAWGKRCTPDNLARPHPRAVQAPLPHSQVLNQHVHGAASRVSPTVTAFVLRDVPFVMNMVAEWHANGSLQMSLLLLRM